MPENCMGRIFDLGPKKFWGAFKNGQNFWFGTPVWAWGAPKCQNFTISVSQARTFKFGQDVDLKSLISYLKKNFGFGPPFPFGRRGPEILKFFIGGKGTPKVSDYF